MSKSVLNELCIKNKWQSPVYSTTKHGPDHIPTFHATVTVNDATFASESVAKSSKEAQNDAARIAVLQLTAAAAAASAAAPAPQPSPGKILTRFQTNCCVFRSELNFGFGLVDDLVFMMFDGVRVCFDYLL
ncbi:Double-stranded RNA-binding protein 1 [Linum perenne]